MRPQDDDDSWQSLVLFANDIAMAYRRANEKLREQIAERDRAIEFYRKLVSDHDRRKAQEGTPCDPAVSRRSLAQSGPLAANRHTQEFQGRGARPSGGRPAIQREPT